MSVALIRLMFVQIGCLLTVRGMPETVLSTKGRIVVPKDVRARLRLKVGQRFKVEALDDGTILVVPISENVSGSVRLSQGRQLGKASA